MTWVWTYDVIDDGTNVNINVKLENTDGSGTTCSKMKIIPHTPPDPNSPLSDDISINCGGAAWTFSIDRDTMIVYIFSGIFAWTPTCN